MPNRLVSLCLPLVVLMASCSTHSLHTSEPATDTSSLVLVGDFTENPSLAARSSCTLVKIGLTLGAEFPFSEPISRLSDDKQLYLVLEYTDTLSASDYHYLPQCWQTVAPGQPLADSVYAYTTRVLRALSAFDIPFVQLSRNIQNGFLWTSESDQLYPNKTLSDNELAWRDQALYLGAAARAVREQCPSAQIVLQLDRVGTTESMHAQLLNTLFAWDRLSLDYDIISLFYHPALRGDLSLLTSTMAVLPASSHAFHLVTCYPSSPLSEENDYITADQLGFPFSPYGQLNFLDSVRTLLPPAFTHLIYRYAASDNAFRLADLQYLKP